jgi:hypothetical protein
MPVKDVEVNSMHSNLDNSRRKWLVSRPGLHYEPFIQNQYTLSLLFWKVGD